MSIAKKIRELSIYIEETEDSVKVLKNMLSANYVVMDATVVSFRGGFSDKKTVFFGDVITNEILSIALERGQSRLSELDDELSTLINHKPWWKK
jgi:RNA binding exosome subunit